MPKKKKEEKETNNKQKVLLIVSIICIIGVILCVILILNNKNKTEEFKIDGLDIVEKEDLLKDTNVDTLLVTDQVLYKQEGTYKFSAIVNNKTDSDYYVKNLYVTFTVNNTEKKILVAKDTNIKANDIKTINISFDNVMKDVTKIEYSIEK